MDDGLGKEIMMVIEHNVNNGGKFWTDSNGLELQPREFQPLKATYLENRIESMFAPVTTFAKVESNNEAL